MPGTLWILSDGGEFEHLASRSRRWDRTLHRALRDELGAAARPAARNAAQAALQLRLPATVPARYRQRRRSTGLRAGISRSVTVVVRDGGDSVAYLIRADHRMARPTDAPTFRHPVYGNRNVWRGQRSQPWWSKSMVEAKPAMRRAPERALERAVREL